MDRRNDLLQFILIIILLIALLEYMGIIDVKRVIVYPQPTFQPVPTYNVFVPQPLPQPQPQPGVEITVQAYYNSITQTVEAFLATPVPQQKSGLEAPTSSVGGRDMSNDPHKRTP